MARKPPLHSVDELLSPALARTITAISPPASDAALVAVATVLAATLDRMTNEERATMLGQTIPPYMKVLAELEARAAKRRVPERPKTANPVRSMREAHASRFGA
jgi:hypothetical protein